MKKINFIGILLIVLILPIISAQEATDAGVTPDSFLWGLDKALDNLNMLLTFDKGEKAKKGIEIARERLLEVREMVEENKLEAAENAKEAHGNFLNKVKDSIKELEKDNSTEEIKKVIEIEKELKEHEDDIEEVNTELKVKIKIEGTITEEQKALINSLLDSLKGQTGEIKIEIKNKKDKTKIKIKQETGKSDKEVDDEIEEIEEEIGFEEIKVKAEIIGNKAQIKIENEFSTDATDKNAIIDEIIKRFALDKETVNKILKIETEEEEELEKDRLKVEAKTEDGTTEIEVELRFTLTTTDREAIINEVVARSQLSREAILKTEEAKEEEELEIEVEIEDEVAEVKIEIGDDEQEFTLETTDKEAILSEIASRLGVTVEQIRNIVEFKIKEKSKEKEKVIEEEETEVEEKGKKEENIKVEEENKDKEECIKKGGDWRRHGLSRVESCNLPTSDAGKECSDASECGGSCIAELSEEDNKKLSQDGIVYTKGKCTAWEQTYGCHAFVIDGKVQGILCAD